MICEEQDYPFREAQTIIGSTELYKETRLEPATQKNKIHNRRPRKLSSKKGGKSRDVSKQIDLDSQLNKLGETFLKMNKAEREVVKDLLRRSGLLD